MSKTEGTWVVAYSFSGTAYLGKISDEHKTALAPATADGMPSVILTEVREVEKFSQPVKTGDRVGIQRLQTLGPIHGLNGAASEVHLFPSAWYYPEDKDIMPLVNSVREEESKVEKRLRASEAGIILPEDDPRTVQ